MNKQRRKRLENISAELTRLYYELQEVRDEEEEAYFNMPVSLQCSERGQVMEECIDMMEELYDSLEEIYSAIDEFVEGKA